MRSKQCLRGIVATIWGASVLAYGLSERASRYSAPGFHAGQFAAMVLAACILLVGVRALIRGLR